MRAVTALWPRVASPQGAASGVSGAGITGRQRRIQVRWAQRTPNAGEPSRRAPQAPVRVAVRIEPPQPGVVDLRGAEFGKPRVCPLPRTLALVRLMQPLPNARVDAGGDNALDIATVTTVREWCRGRAAGRGWAGRAWRLRSQKGRCATGAHVELGDQVLCNRCREGGEKA